MRRPGRTPAGVAFAATMANPLDLLRRRTAGFLTNLEAGPPWPGKVVPLLRNRARATVRGCCGNPGQPGC
jgi:hypothetical protein